ncbi:MAG TPA: thiamine diphosphokinase [Candidatus Fimivicinus intestinavium]|nr:thiamine diphosphokinase [Candidatus Fimivicinus intestinavium]
MMARCVLLGAAPIRDYQACASFFRPGDFLLCVDGGYLHARRMGLCPDLLLGDFDSSRLPEDLSCEILSYPPEKDDTDMLLALKAGLERGFRDFLILGGLGGRLDHTVANFTVLAYALEHGAGAVLRDEKNIAFLLRNGSVSVPFRPGFKMSVFPYGGAAQGVCLRGVQYPLESYYMPAYCTLGVSNEVLPSGAEVSVASGTLLLLFSMD